MCGFCVCVVVVCFCGVLVGGWGVGCFGCGFVVGVGCCGWGGVGVCWGGCGVVGGVVCGWCVFVWWWGFVCLGVVGVWFVFWGCGCGCGCWVG
ncbi:hypothetical protein RA268_28150, partial [Pseudomonas syringae pv. tagetis]